MTSMEAEERRSSGKLQVESVRPIVCALLLRIRKMAAAVLTDGDRAAELGEGALRARWPVTDFAPRADRHDGRGVVRLDDPQRATAADSGEVKGGSRLTLRDVSGAIGSDEEERDAALAVSLESGQPVADCLEADLELEAEQVDVVPQGLSGLQKLGVRE